MIKRRAIFLFVGLLIVELSGAQGFIKTNELMVPDNDENSGELAVFQDPAIDTLLSRSVIGNKKRGIQGVRIQIYNSSVRNAREESARMRADFISNFPDIVSYIEYQEPGWFKVRVGNYRSKIEAYKDLQMILEEYPDAYSVLTTIESPYNYH